MDMKKSFGVNKDAAENGKWFDLEHGGRAKIAKLGNIAFIAEVQRLSKPHAALLRSGMDTSDIMDKITTAAMAKTILLDWDGINVDGESIAYSTENAEKLLTEYRAFRETISEFSVERKNFAPEEVAEK